MVTPVRTRSSISSRYPCNGPVVSSIFKLNLKVSGFPVDEPFERSAGQQNEPWTYNKMLYDSPGKTDSPGSVTPEPVTDSSRNEEEE
jgi:hypothetical protein